MKVIRKAVLTLISFKKIFCRNKAGLAYGLDLILCFG
jgi:hypothetical protein